MHTLFILLQAAAPAAGTPAAAPAGGISPGLMNLLMIGLIVVVFYFFMIRPQMKKQKEQTNFLGEIGKGTKIVTIGGIVGKVVEVRNKTFVIEVEGGTKLQVLKSAISLENSKAINAEAGEEKKEKEKSTLEV
ncbi:MAG TPA: preprotein translocase subunit YajC [Bacteroidia bacterium]|jgi:preprotein translocase subunit YajC|nr:preprotein translocase subunit YajC [Bacteroidia bacterium]